MVATTLFLSLVISNGSAAVWSPATTEPRPMTPVHLVQPAGVAVPLARRDRAPAPSDLFKSPVTADRETAFAATASSQASPSATATVWQAIKARLVCRL